jgi:hypothetical protein
VKLDRAALAAAVIAGVGIGVPVGIGDRAHDHSDETRDGIEFEVPPHYKTADLTVDTLAGALSITDARADAPARTQDGATAIVGLLPPGTLVLTRREPVPGLLSEPPRLVELGPEVAVHLRGSATAEDGSHWRVTMYIVAAKRGDVALACASQAAVDNDACERIVTTLKIPGSLGALPERKTLREYRERVDTTVSVYERRTTELRRELRRAHTREAQAFEARKLASLCGGTSTNLGSLPPDPLAREAQRTLRAALGAQQRAYSWLAREALRDSRSAYDRARRSVEKTDRDVLAREREVWSVSELHVG